MDRRSDTRGYTINVAADAACDLRWSTGGLRQEAKCKLTHGRQSPNCEEFIYTCDKEAETTRGYLRS